MATEVGRIIARYIAETSSFDAGNARVRGQMAATSAAATKSGGMLRGYGKYGVLAVGVGLVKAMSFFADAEKSMNVFAANTSASASEMKAAWEMVKDLGRDPRFPGVTTGDTAAALVELGKAGLEPKQAIEALESTMLLGTAGQMDYADAAKLSANAMNMFEKQAKDLPGIVDAIAGAALTSSAEVKDVAEAFRYAGSAASLLGVPLKEATAMIGLLSSRGLSGSFTGSTLRMFFTSLASARSAKASSLMKELGFQDKAGKSLFFDAAGNIKPMEQVFAIWKKGTEGMNRQAKLATAHTLFGVRGLNMIPLMDKGAKEFEDSFKKSTKKGAANRLAEAYTKGLYGSFQNLINSVQSFATTLGEKLAPAATIVLDALSAVFDLIGKHEGTANVLAHLVVGAVIAFTLFRTALVLWTISMWAAGTAMKVYSTLMFGIPKLLAAARTAMLLFNSAMLLNPFVLITVAIIGVILILRHFGIGLRDIWNEAKMVWKALKAAFWAGYHAIRNALGTALNWIKGNWPKLLLLMTGFFPLIIMAVWKLGHKLWALFKEYAGKAAHAVWEKIKKIPGLILEAGEMIYNAAKDLGLRIIHGIIDGIKSMPGAIKNAVVEATGIPVNIVEGAWSGATSAVQAVPVVGAAANLLSLGFNGKEQAGPSVNIESMSVRSEEDPYVIASVLGRRMALAQ